MKQCTDCKETKPLTAFTKNKGSKMGVYSMCKVCRSRRRTADPLKTLAGTIRYKYGMTLIDFTRILDSQGGVCYICGTDEPGGRGFWHVDHDHRCCPDVKTCGKCVRGILCVRCNLQVGGAEAILSKFDNDSDKMLAYINRRL